MSELAKKARNAMRDKLSRLMRTDPKAKVDGSSYVPPEPLNADVKTGLRPISRRQFKKGGKVVMMNGKPVKLRADRKARKNGGSAKATPNNIINRDVKEANQEREGKKHVGGMKKGGRIHKMDGGDVAQVLSPAYALYKNRDKKLVKALSPIANLKRGGKTEHSDVKSDKALIKKMVHKHEAAKHPGKPMTKLKHGGYAKKAGGGYSTGGNPPKPAPTPPRPPQMPEDVANDYNAWKISQEVKREEAASKRPAPPAPKKARGGSLDGTLQGTRPTGGRLARNTGGRNMGKGGGNKGKGKMNVNIIIGGGRDGQQPMMPRPPMPPAGIPVPVGAAPPAGGPPMGMPPMGGPPMGAAPPMPPMGGMGGLPGGMPPMPRKTGGRAIGVDKPGRVGHRKYRSASDMDAGAASGLGRLEKVEIQKHKH